MYMTVHTEVYSPWNGSTLKICRKQFDCIILCTV